MSIHKDNATGKWRVVYRYTDWTGERKQTQKRGFATKREATAWEREVMLQNSAELDMTFESFYEIYKSDRNPRIKESTWETKTHIVEKKIPYLNEAGELVKPEAPNGYKFENLVLDMIHKLDSCLPFEVVRNKEFAPVKNKTGVDSVDSARILLKENGVEI